MVELLGAAAETIAEVGYEAATMTAIAERAGASIGAVYQYFPNKEALGLALRAAVRRSELSARWTPLTTDAEGASVEELVERVFGVLFEFFAARPAFVPLLTGALPLSRGTRRSAMRLREDFAKLFRTKRPALAGREAFRVANVTRGTSSGRCTRCTPRPRGRSGSRSAPSSSGW